MADYAKPGDLARSFRSQAESNRRVRTRRPLNDQVPIIGWHIEGAITTSRQLGPLLVRIDEDRPEHKEITGFNAWMLSGGPVLIEWQSNFHTLVDEHSITAATDNETILPVPFIIENGDVGGEFIRPVIFSVTGTPTPPLCLYIYVRTVPI